MYYRELKKETKTDDQTPERKPKPDAPRRAVANVSPDVEGLGELDLKALNLKEDHRDDPLVVELRRDIRRSFMVLDEPPKNVAPVSPAPSYLSMIFCASDIDWDFCSSFPRARRVRRRETIRAATSFFFVGQRLSRRTTRPRASTTTRATPTTSTTTRATSCSHIFPPRRSRIICANRESAVAVSVGVPACCGGGSRRSGRGRVTSCLDGCVVRAAAAAAPASALPQTVVICEGSQRPNFVEATWASR